jgi:hypothetical protein
MNLKRLRLVLLLYVAFDFLLGYAGIFPITNLVAAQFTIVTGTVTDPNGLPYANGTISALLVTSASPTLSGFPYTPPTQPTGLDLTGSFTMQLADNTVLLPPGTQWNFTVCSAIGTVLPAGGKGPVCFSLAAPITISGASQSITANLNAVAPALTISTSGATINPTNNVIPKRLNATSFANSALTDNGTTLLLPSVYPFGWNSDICLSRSAAGQLALGNCTQNDQTGFFLLNGLTFGGATTNADIDFNHGATFSMNNAFKLGWSSTGSSSAALDVSQTRQAANILQVGDAGNNSNGKLALAALLSEGTTFTAAGCANSTLVGGATAGKYTSVTAGSCTVTITMGNTATAPTGWACDAHDITTVADANNVTMGTSTTTTANLVEGTVAANDVIVFKCVGY